MNFKIHQSIFIVLMLIGVACNATAESQTPPSPSALISEPPSVTIHSPLNGSDVLEGEEVLIYSIALDSEGVTRIDLLQNEIVLDSLTSPSAAPRLEVLQAWQAEGVGEQTLQVIAYRDEVASEAAELTLLVRAQASQIQTPAASPTILVPLESADLSCRARVNINNLPTFYTPDLNNPATELAIGQTLPVVGRSDDDNWWQLDSGVWVQAVYTTLLGDCSAAGTACKAQFVATQVTVRREPAETAPILFTFNPPAQVQFPILQSEAAWVQLDIDGTLGWVRAAEIVNSCDATVPSPTPSASPVVEVSGGNLPPVVDAIPNQTLITGQQLTVPVSALDPEGFNWSLMDIESGSPQVALVEADGEGNLLISGVSPGQVDVRFTVTDGVGGNTRSIFRVEVLQATNTPNRPPTVDAIPNQTLRVGEQLVIQVNALDPDGFNPYIESISSAAETIATINAGEDRKIAIQGVSAGETLMTVTVSDGNAGTTSVSFGVTVLPPPSATPNLPPVIEDIAPVTVLVGSTLLVPIIVNDPEGSNPFFSDIQSSAASIVEAAGDGSGNIVLKGISAGQAEVRFTVEDLFGGQTKGRFQVMVISPTDVPNLPPRVDAIPDQSVTVGGTRLVELNASDPEGFNLFLARVVSSAQTIVNVESDGNNNVVLEGVSVGQATVTATLDDGSGGQTTITFNVTVVPESTLPPNQAPIVQPVSDQTVVQNQFVDIQIQATDPEGFNPYLEFAYSEDIGIAQVDNIGNNTIRVRGIAGGETVVGVSVADGNGATKTITFGVTVEGLPPTQPNQAPVVEPIPDQRVAVGQSIAVFVEARDPEGYNLFFADIRSAAPTIAQAGASGDGNIWVTGVSAGTVEISAVIDDSVGGQTTFTFTLEVFDAGIPDAGGAPQIAPIPPQTVKLGEFLPLAVSATDPEGSPVTLIATSNNEGVAPVQLTDGGITIFGAGAGQVSVSIIAMDAQGASSSVVFLVTVTGEESATDLATLPVLPEWSPEVVANLQTLAQESDQALILGDVSPAALTGNGALGELDLSANPEVATTLARYGGTIQGVDGLVAELLKPADCPMDSLNCALETYTPAVVFVLVGQQDVQANTPPATFEADLNTLISDLTSRKVIPIMATLAGDAALLEPYNQAIVRVAQANQIPVVNIWGGIPQSQIKEGLFLSAPPNDEALTRPESYGTSLRNFYLWQALTELNAQLAP